MKRANSINQFIYKLPVYILIVFIIWFSFTFIIYPLFTVVLESFTENGSFSLSAFDKILRSERALVSIRNSVLTAIFITFSTTIIGVLQVLIVDYFDIKGANLLRIAYMSPLVFGGLILNNGYLYVYGENGIVTQFLIQIFPNLDPKWFSGAPAVFFVMTFGCTHPFMIFYRNAILSIDNNLIDAAKNLGSSQWEFLRKIVIPSVKPTLITLIIMTFATGLNAFAAPVMVGGREFQTIAPLILTFSQRPNSRDLAALMSIFLGLAQIILLMVMTRNEAKGNYMSISKSKTVLQKQKIGNPVINLIVHFLAYILFFIHAMPAVMIVLSSFLNTEALVRNEFSLEALTLEHYITVLTNSGNYEPFIRSVILSIISALGSVLLMLIVVRLVMNAKGNRFISILEYPFYIPWLVPAILIALGYIMAYDRPHPLLLGNSVIGELWILPIAYMVVVLPTTIRYLKSAYFNVDHSLEDASQNLGASQVRTFFKIVLPAVLPTALALFALNFNANLAEYNISAFLYPPGQETLGIVIRTNSSPTATIDAKAINMVYSVILMIISSIVLYIVYGRGTEFSKKTSGLNS